MLRELNSILTIAFRDFTKLLRDKARIISSFIFPVIFIGALGGSFEANLGNVVNFDFLTFVFTGVFAQTLFQSTTSGVIFLIQDRESDFSQEIFVSPISRYSIILGKILGETMVSYVQILGVLIFGFIIGVQMSVTDVLLLLGSGLAACLLGGAFGVMVLANMGNVRSATQIFPFLIFPQFFLSGVFTPIKALTWDSSSLINQVLFVLSRIAPMTYAVDFIRGIFYLGKPDYDAVVLYHPLVNLIIISLMFLIMLAVGTFLFVRSERNR